MSLEKLVGNLRYNDEIDMSIFRFENASNNRRINSEEKIDFTI